MIDPGKLADAAAMHERAARDRLAFKSSSHIVPDGPMSAATRAQVDAALEEVREAFVAGARYAESRNPNESLILENASWAALSEPHTTDYCVRCGESPESGSHLPHGHAYEDPRIQRYALTYGPANDTPADIATRLAMDIEIRAAELAYVEAYRDGFTIAEANGWRCVEGSIICGPSDPGWQAGYLARVIIDHKERR